MIKQIIIKVGMLLSIFHLIGFFGYLLPIKRLVLFGFWGQSDPNVIGYNRIYVPDFENLGLPHTISLIINYLLSYLFVFAVFFMVSFFLFKLQNRLYNWYLNEVDQIKTERNFKTTKLDNLAVTLSIYILSILKSISYTVEVFS